MKTHLLYMDITTEKISTFHELKSAYEYEINAEMEIDDDTMQSIIFENLWSTGGNIKIINLNDDILRFCHDYAERMEAERCMAENEIEESIRDIYISITKKDNYMIEEIKDNLYPDENAEDKDLIERLEKLIAD